MSAASSPYRDWNPRTPRLSWSRRMGTASCSTAVSVPSRPPAGFRRPSAGCDAVILSHGTKTMRRLTCLLVPLATDGNADRLCTAPVLVGSPTPCGAMRFQATDVRRLLGIDIEKGADGARARRASGWRLAVGEGILYMGDTCGRSRSTVSIAARDCAMIFDDSNGNARETQGAQRGVRRRLPPRPVLMPVRRGRGPEIAIFCRPRP